MESGKKRKSVEEAAPRWEGLPGAGTPPGGKGQVLFVEVVGDLLGIDLDKLGSDSQEYSNSPPSAPICYNFKLRRYGYPLGMRHFRLNDKHYLLGGIKLERMWDKDLSSRRVLARNFRGYSKRVYEFDPSKATNDLKNYKQVLRHHDIAIPPLNAGKFALVANLKGKIYVLHSPANPFIPFANYKEPAFEVYDPTANSWLQAPTPPFYPKVERASWNRDSPVFTHFILDDKLFVYACDHCIYFFDPESGWRMSFSCIDSFRRSGQFPPDKGICVPVLHLIHDDYKVVLSVGESFEETFSTQKAFGFVMKKTGQVLFLQTLDEVFSEIKPDTDLLRSTHFLIDLGESNKVNSNRRRICAILSGVDPNGYSILCISIFDVRFLDNLDLLHYCCSSDSDDSKAKIVKQLNSDSDDSKAKIVKQLNSDDSKAKIVKQLNSDSDDDSDDDFTIPERKVFLDVSVVKKYVCRLDKVTCPVLDAFLL